MMIDCSPNAFANIYRLEQDEAESLPLIDQSEVRGRPIVCPTPGCRSKASLEPQRGQEFGIGDQRVPRHLNTCRACKGYLQFHIKVALWPDKPTSPAPKPLEVSEALRSTTYV